MSVSTDGADRIRHRHDERVIHPKYTMLALSPFTTDCVRRNRLSRDQSFTADRMHFA